MGETQYIATSAKQDEIRRQKKKAQRAGLGGNKRRAADNTGFLAGLQQDRHTAALKAREDRMLELLKIVMISPSPTAHELLVRATRVYLTVYTSANVAGNWKGRHEHALEATLKDIPEGRLRKYARSRLEQIETATRYMTR